MMVNPLTELPIERLRERTSLKWRTYPADVLPLWVAEMDVPLAPPIHAALSRALELGDTGYPAGTAYAEGFRDFAADRWGWREFDIARTAIVPDVMMGIVEILRLITHANDAVVVTAPVYPPFYAFVTHADRRIVEARLADDGRLDFASLEEAFVTAGTTSTRPVLLLSNPHNPTGAVHTRSELEQLAALAGRHGVRVISDEIHAPLVLSGARFSPYLSVVGAENAFALVSASKGWNLAGLKAALIIAGPDAAGDLARLPEEVSHGPSHLGVIAHTAAFRDGGDWLNALLSGLENNRELLEMLIADHLPGTTLCRPEGSYLAWLDCRALDLHHAPPAGELGVVSDVAGPAKFFLDHARVALSSGHVFGTGGTGHVRINFATNPDILTTAIHRMGQALTEASTKRHVG